LLINSDLRRIVGQACHLESLLDNVAGLGLAVDAIGVELEGWHVDGLIFTVAKCVKSCALAIDFVLNNYVVDNRAKVEDILDVLLELVEIALEVVRMLPQTNYLLLDVFLV
jgi:hypothetical protein